MTDQIIVRTAVKDDIENIVELWWILEADHQKRDEFYWENIDEGGARQIYEKFITENIKSKSIFLYVAEINNEVCGFIHGVILDKAPVYEITRAGRVNEIVVSSSHRKKGVAKALLSALENKFKEQGLLVMDLMVDVENPEAAALYKSFGMYPREYHMIRKL
jgi:ribosomal protein S18 acetylase RimI-like enzyme